MTLVGASPLIREEAASLAREGVHLYPVLELVRRCLSLGFLLLIMATYLTRVRAVAPARGFLERIFPILVLFVAPTGLWLTSNTEIPHRLELVGMGMLLCLLGYAVSLWSLWHLRGSFAIMAEARSLVTSGPYEYIRHPLYLGEQLTMLGLCLMTGTVITLLFWAFFTGLQLTRARIEENKLARQFDDYRTYQEKTRFILPGLY